MGESDQICTICPSATFFHIILHNMKLGVTLESISCLSSSWVLYMCLENIDICYNFEYCSTYLTFNGCCGRTFCLSATAMFCVTIRDWDDFRKRLVIFFLPVYPTNVRTCRVCRHVIYFSNYLHLSGRCGQTSVCNGHF